jgi:hypothetical protein
MSLGGIIIIGLLATAFCWTLIWLLCRNAAIEDRRQEIAHGDSFPVAPIWIDGPDSGPIFDSIIFDSEIEDDGFSTIHPAFNRFSHGRIIGDD